jgi:CheY-like chemotaxis protein
MDRKGILVVEDDRDILENLTQAFEFEGYDPYGVENGQIALEYLRSLPSHQLPKCILLDLMMPVMDGITFAQTLAHDHPKTLARIPIIILTAKGNFSQDEPN